jgi:hypothetical protein
LPVTFKSRLICCVSIECDHGVAASPVAPVAPAGGPGKKVAEMLFNPGILRILEPAHEIVGEGGEPAGLATRARRLYPVCSIGFPHRPIAMQHIVK